MLGFAVQSDVFLYGQLRHQNILKKSTSYVTSAILVAIGTVHMTLYFAKVGDAIAAHGTGATMVRFI